MRYVFRRCPLSYYSNTFFTKLPVSVYIKYKLEQAISSIVKHSERFTISPQDFSRNRKLNLETSLKFILAMGGQSLSSELLKYFKFSPITPTASAFIQARKKIKIEAFEKLFQATRTFDRCQKQYKGYLLYAHDGSDINLPRDKLDHTTYIKTAKSRYNLLHLNALYDVLNKNFVSVDFQGRNEIDERESLLRMVDKSKFKQKTIIIADRGYRSFNVYEYLKQRGQKFVIREKDVKSKGLLNNLPLPKKDCFDTEIVFKLTRRQTKEIRSDPSYHFLSTTSKFDFLPIGAMDYYVMKIRVVRFKIGENAYESIVTNLDEREFSADDIKKLYHLRWGIETSFRELKYALGLASLHAKKKAFIYQEIYARLIMYNFSMMIAMSVLLEKKETKHNYQINFTQAFGICKAFFCSSSINVRGLIKKYILPIREGRADPRKLANKGFSSFLYRIA